MIGGFRVLVVDDDVDTLEATTLLLELVGYRPRAAASGTSGLATMESFAPHVVLIDRALPDMTGYDLARKIRRRKARAPYLAMISGWSSAAHERMSADAGFDEWLVKPAPVSILRGVMERAGRAIARN
jgi:DNA-binding response OmpR family regulator